MSEPKFTKGPWKCTKTQDYYNLGVTEHYYDVYQIKGANKKIITELDAEEMEKDENIKENAALIAAAPEMYELLQDIATNYQCMPNPYGVEQRIKAVLKKARGEK